MVDGTHVFVSGTKAASGNPIQRTIHIGGRAVTVAIGSVGGRPAAVETVGLAGSRPVAVDALGLVAVRLDKRGRLEALAAGGLKSLNADKFKIELPERVDLALWRDGRGQFHGVLQGWSGAVPEPLQKLTKDWLRLSVPTPLE